MRLGMRQKCWQSIVVLICQLLALEPLLAQQPGAQGGLRIVIVEGAAARNVVQQIAPRPLVVRIDDANNRAVSGAVVVFTAPEGGPSGEFANDSRIARVTTGPDGLAVAGTYHPNGIEGGYQIQVRAEFQGQMTTTTIAQANVAQKKGHGKLIAILAIGGAAAAAAIASRSGSSSTTSNTPTITFGGAAVGAPK